MPCDMITTCDWAIGEEFFKRFCCARHTSCSKWKKLNKPPKLPVDWLRTLRIKDIDGLYVKDKKDTR